MDFIARDDAEMARKVYAEIRKQGAELAHFPNIGRPGRIPGTRELIVVGYSYILPYRVKNEVVEILRVFHTSQRPPKMW
ncbi:type II toxin-antitoxin system RelE/ParE family toxin [Desulfonatronum parangueonense]